MSAGRIAAVSLLARKLLPLATPSTCSPAQRLLDNIVAGSLLRACQLLLQPLTAGAYGNRWVQTAAEHSLPRQALHGPSWFKAAQHDTDSASRQTTSADWQTSIFEDGFQDGIGQPEGDFLPKPLLRRLKQLAIQGQYTELVDLYHSEEILQATRAMNLGLMSLPVRDVPYFYKAIAEGLNIQPNAMSVALLIRSLGKLNRVSDAEAIWHDCQAQGLNEDPVIVGAMCGAYAHAGAAEAIEGMIEDAKAAGLPPVMSAYTSLINAYGARSSLPEVRRVMLEMKEDGVEANRLHYKAAIHAHGQAGRPTEAQYLLTEMAAAGLTPDVMIIGTMINAYAENNQPRRAAAVMQTYIDAGGQPTQMLCNQLAKAWSRQGEVGEVRAVMANMRSSDVKTDLFTWSSLVHACAIAGQMGKAREAMKEMAATGLAPGVVCYTVLLNAYGKQGDLAAASEVLKDMKANGVQPNKFTYSSLMGWHSQEGNLAKVQEIQQLMVAEKIDTDAVGHMFGIEAAMEAWDKAGRPNDMLTQANDMWHRSPIVDMKPIFKSHDSRSWRSTYVDLHGYSHWTCQLALLSGLQQLYHNYSTPGWVWPQADFVQLVPVRLAAKNDGLVVVKRRDILKFFGIIRRQQDPLEVTNFGACFKPRTEVLEYAGPNMF